MVRHRVVVTWYHAAANSVNSVKFYPQPYLGYEKVEIVKASVQTGMTCGW